ncbi:TPR repeat-containing protein [Lachnospiraceae bacterium]|nr:TPR repeat-containing protein [Lachnospiraceae bacterium]
MKCYNCGCTLSEDDFCTACGADVGVYKRIIRLSNTYYNEGLERARIRDLSGAAECLRQSLKCNKNNIPARNLLGLVYFEMGEVVSALSEWIISKSIRPRKNIADDFINDVQNNQTRLNSVNQAVKKYNQALSYAKRGDLDLAVIQLKKVLSLNGNLMVAYQLLGLIYIHNKEYMKAKKILERAIQIDSGNTAVRTYLQEAKQEIAEREAKTGKPLKKREEAITYQSGNETIIQPLNGPERTGRQTIVNILIGLALGIAVMWFLVLPARIQSAKSDINDHLKNVSEELTTKSADMDDLNRQIESLQQSNDEAQLSLEEYTGSSGVMQDYNYLLQAAQSYINDPEDALTAASYLEQIQTTSGNQVSEQFLGLYKFLDSNVSAKAAEQYLSSGIDQYNDGDYAGAIENLTRAYDLDQESDSALYYLAQSYLKSDNKDKATELFNRLISDFPNSSFKSKAQRFLDKGEEDDSKASPEEGNTADTTGQNNAADEAAQQAALQAALQAQALQQAQEAAAAAAAQQQQQQAAGQ